jgi:predicted nuclease of predicted toxin-antitoxin system
MLLLIDENVPNAVANFLRQRGHSVLLVRDQFVAGTADRIIAQWAHQNRAVIVTWDADFRSNLVRRASRGQQRFFNLGLISFRCPPQASVERLRRVIDLIEFEYDRAQERPDKRMIVEIHSGHFVLRG